MTKKSEKKNLIFLRRHNTQIQKHIKHQLQKQQKHIKQQLQKQQLQYVNYYYNNYNNHKNFCCTNKAENCRHFSHAEKDAPKKNMDPKAKKMMWKTMSKKRLYDALRAIMDDVDMDMTSEQVKDGIWPDEHLLNCLDPMLKKYDYDMD